MNKKRNQTLFLVVSVHKVVKVYLTPATKNYTPLEILVYHTTENVIIKYPFPIKLLIERCQKETSNRSHQKVNLSFLSVTSIAERLDMIHQQSSPMVGHFQLKLTNLCNYLKHSVVQKVQAGMRICFTVYLRMLI